MKDLWIPLIQGLQTVIYEEDWDLIKDYRWYAQKDGKRYYAATNTWEKVGTGSPKRLGKRSREGGLQMHTLILPLIAPFMVDHQDGDGLNNRRSNLRAATKGQNVANSPPRGRHGVKGVAFHSKRSKPWQATFQDRDKGNRSLGYYASKEEAARAWDVAAYEKYGEFAYLNYPEEMD